MKKGLFLLYLFVLFGFALAQVNQWTRIVPGPKDSLHRTNGCMVYLPDSNFFLLSWGIMDHDSVPYSEQVFSFTDSLWKNHFPTGKLGVWGDLTGPARNTPGFGSADIAMLDQMGNVRPNLTHWDHPNVYYQYAYDTDEGKVYYFVRNKTLRYDPRTRAWEVLSPSTHPADVGNKTVLVMGAMCYDPHNQEILLFGGMCVDVRDASPHTWVYKPATNTWSRLNPAVEPPARANSPMVYDPVNMKIVLFSGDHNDGLLGDTWVYDVLTKTWQKKSPAISPKPRTGHALLYLPKSGKVVMMGGYTYYRDVTDAARGTTAYSVIDSFEIWTYDVASDSWGLVRHFNQPEPVCFSRPYYSVFAADTGDRVIYIGMDPKPGSGARNYAMTYVLRCDPTVDAAGTSTYGWPTDSLWRRAGRHTIAYYHTEDATIDTVAQESLLRSLTPNLLTYVPQPKSRIPGRDYGTICYSPDHDVIFGWGGGHSTICYNDVPEFHIAKNRWYIGYVPEGAFQYQGSGWGGPKGPVTFNGRPYMQVHPYDHYDYCPLLKKVLFFHDFYTHVYNPVKQDFDTILIPHHSGMNASTAYYRSLNASPHGMVAWTKKTSGAFGLWMLDTATGVWRTLPIRNGTAVPTYYCEQAGQVYDPNRDRMLFTNVYETGQVWEYRFSDSTLNKLNPVDTSLVSNVWRVREWQFMPSFDQVIGQDTVSVRGRVGLPVYDCKENRWKCAPIACNTSYDWKQSMSGRGTIVDKRGLIWFVDQKNAGVFVLKYADSTLTLSTETALPNLKDGPALRANPNPFNPATVIRLQGIRPEGEKPVLSIFDSQGRLVEQIAAAHQRQGETTYPWRASQVASGIYIARWVSGQTVLEKKLILMR